MTTAEWLAKANEHKTKLRDFLADWHPARPVMGHDMRITALQAERACQGIREHIRDKEQDQPDPVRRFDFALAAGDWAEINSLLNSAWFGVPESRSCWTIVGFSEAVELMEELPDEAYQDQQQPGQELAE